MALRCSISPPPCHVRSLPLLLSPFGSLPKQTLDHRPSACLFPWQLCQGAQCWSSSEEQRAWFRASPRALDAGRSFCWTRYPKLKILLQDISYSVKAQDINISLLSLRGNLQEQRYCLWRLDDLLIGMCNYLRVLLTACHFLANEICREFSRLTL